MCSTVSMLRVSAPVAASRTRQCVAQSNPAAKPSAAPAASLTRRQMAGLFGASLLAGLVAQPAQAYGGSGNLRATDAGSGNPRYDDLMRSAKAQGQAPLDIEAYKRATGREEKKEGGSRPVCLTGKEKACQ